MARGDRRSEPPVARLIANAAALSFGARRVRLPSVIDQRPQVLAETRAHLWIGRQFLNRRRHDRGEVRRRARPPWRRSETTPGLRQSSSGAGSRRGSAGAGRAEIHPLRPGRRGSSPRAASSRSETAPHRPTAPGAARCRSAHGRDQPRARPARAGDLQRLLFWYWACMVESPLKSENWQPLQAAPQRLPRGDLGGCVVGRRLASGVRSGRGRQQTWGSDIRRKK